MKLVKQCASESISRRFLCCSGVKLNQDALQLPVMPPGPAPKSLAKWPKMSYEKFLEVKRDSLNRSLQPYYRRPLLVSSANMQWIFDQDRSSDALSI